MIAYLYSLIARLYGYEPLAITPLGDGFYGRVFLVDLPMDPQRLVFKVYNKPGMAESEKQQLDMLREHTLIPMPLTYAALPADGIMPHDVLIMQYLEGVNAGIQADVCEASRARIAKQVVDNLLAYHAVKHPLGFGELNATSFAHDFRLYYKPLAQSITKDADFLYHKQQLSHETLDTVLNAYRRFDDIFYLPIREASLIHGDYNMWNILLDGARQNAVAVIDPCGCGWFDSEYDLYQLDNANGKVFGLLDLYRQKVPLSENFDLKRCFYELFTEIQHFVRAGVDASDSALPTQAENLRRQMALHHIA